MRAGCGKPVMVISPPSSRIWISTACGDKSLTLYRGEKKTTSWFVDPHRGFWAEARCRAKRPKMPNPDRRGFVGKENLCRQSSPLYLRADNGNGHPPVHEAYNR